MRLKSPAIIQGVLSGYEMDESSLKKAGLSDRDDGAYMFVIAMGWVQTTVRRSRVEEKVRCE